jgi:hypothetical protein
LQGGRKIRPNFTQVTYQVTQRFLSLETRPDLEWTEATARQMIKNCHRIENAIPLRVHRKCESGESVLNSSRILKHFVNAVNYILLIVVQIKFIVYGSKIIENGVQTPVLVAFGAGVSVHLHLLSDCQHVPKCRVQGKYHGRPNGVRSVQATAVGNLS